MRKDAVRNRELLIHAAREVFAARGFEASMDDIAHHAGLGVGTAYRHFANKYELANAIFDQAVDAFVNSAESALSAADAWAALVDVLERTLEAQTRNRAIREILLGVRQDGPAYHDSMMAPFDPLFARAKAQGAIRPDAELSDLSLTLIMLCTVADTTAQESPYLWRRYLPILLDGLRPGGAELPVPPLMPDQIQRVMAVPDRRPVLRSSAPAGDASRSPVGATVGSPPAASLAGAHVGSSSAAGLGAPAAAPAGSGSVGSGSVGSGSVGSGSVGSGSVGSGLGSTGGSSGSPGFGGSTGFGGPVNRPASTSDA